MYDACNTCSHVHVRVCINHSYILYIYIQVVSYIILKEAEYRLRDTISSKEKVLILLKCINIKFENFADAFFILFYLYVLMIGNN